MPAALVGIISVAVAGFVEVGANCRVIWHWICGASVAQVFVTMVNAGDPVIVGVLIVTGFAVVFCTKTARPRVLPTCVFANAAGFGDIEILPLTPVPVIGTLIVPAASVWMLSVDVNGPVAAGWKRTVNVHDVCPPCPDAFNVAGHVPPTIANDTASPTRLAALTCTGPTPVLLNVTVNVRVAPSCVSWNGRLVGCGVTLAATPVPVRVTVCGLPDASLTIDTLPFR